VEWQGHQQSYALQQARFAWLLAYVMTVMQARQVP